MIAKLHNYLINYTFQEDNRLSLFEDNIKKGILDFITVDDIKVPKYINEFWTAKQRQASSLHEVTYRACFKPQLPRFFIQLLTKENDFVYDPFSGRGTTAIESALLNRNVIANDINPLSKILAAPRLSVPTIKDVQERLIKIQIDASNDSDLDLSMFYHTKTLKEIISLKNYFIKRKINKQNDYIDAWIEMVATNRLTGHSKGFFSVYTLPPNQAILPKRQIIINKKRNQKPEYRNVKAIIFKKTKDLLRDFSDKQRNQLNKIAQKTIFLAKDARYTPEIKSNSITLTVTSPPFLDIVKYSDDNWLRCWFNNIDSKLIEKQITMSKTTDEWCNVMGNVFKELFRITKKDGWVAFEVGEIRNKNIKLEEYVIPLGEKVGFKTQGVMINEQIFTKTSNIWGVKNNKEGTNSNRIIIFKK